MAQPMIVDDYAAIAQRMGELRGKIAGSDFLLPPGCMIVPASNRTGMHQTNVLLFFFQEDDWSLYPHPEQLGDSDTIRKFYEVLKRAFPSARPSPNTHRPQIYLSGDDGRRLRDWLRNTGK